MFKNYINKYRNYDFKKRLNSLTEISNIRFLKGLHMLQDSILMMILCLFFGDNINDLFSDLDENKSKKRLILECVLHIFVLLITIYYLKKIINLIPFLLAFGDYSLIHRSSDSENSISMASTLVIALVLNTTQKNLKEKIIYLGKHYKIYD